MLFVLDRDFKTLCIASNESENTLHFYNDNIHTDLTSGVSTFEFTVDKSHKKSKYIQEGNFVTVLNKKGKQLLFTIIEVEDGNSEKSVYCEDVGLDLLNEAKPPVKYTTAQPISVYIEEAISDSGWEIGVNEVSNLNRTLEFTSFTNALERVLSICTSFDNAEIEFTVEFDGKFITKQLINIYKKRGRETGIRLNAGKDLVAARRTVTLDNLATGLYGVGSEIPQENENTAKQFVDFKSIVYDDGRFYQYDGYLFDRESNKKWSRYRKQSAAKGFIVDYYSYDTDSPQELFNRTLEQLKERCEPSVTYEVDVAEIDENLSIGDTITVVDPDFNPALYLSARVLEIDESETNPSTDKIKLGNYKLVKPALDAQLTEMQQTLSEMRKTWTAQNQAALTVESTKGEVFFDNVISTNLEAKVFRGGINITQSYNSSDFVWTKTDKFGVVVNGWTKTGPIVAITSVDLLDKSIFICNVAQMENRVTLFNLPTTIKSNTAPTDPQQGQQWIDTSITPPRLNIYLSGQWKKVEGETGPQGVPGTSAPIMYMWKMYADDENGTGISEFPDGKRYLGIAYNKTSSTPSVNPVDYSWSPLYDNVIVGGSNLVPHSYTAPTLSYDFYKNTKLIVTDPLDSFYASYPNPPIGGVFNNINVSNGNLTKGVIDFPAVANSILVLLDLYTETSDVRYLNKAKTIGDFILNSSIQSTFYGTTMTLIPNRWQYNATTFVWEQIIGEIALRTQYQAIWALSKLYRISTVTKYKDEADKLIRTVGNAYNSVKSRADGSDLATWMAGAAYSAFYLTGTPAGSTFTFSWGLFEVGTIDVMAEGISEYITATSNASRTDWQGTYFTPQAILTDFATHIKGRYSAGTLTMSGTGLPYGFIQNGVFCNYDWVDTFTYGNVWFANDVELWIIRGLAKLGETDATVKIIATTYRNAFLALKATSHPTYSNVTNECLFYDRYNFNGTHLVEDTSLSITATGLMWTIDKLLGITTNNAIYSSTLAIHQYKNFGNPNIDGSFGWDAADSISHTEVKATGEIYESPYLQVVLASSSGTTSTGYLVKSYTLTQDIIPGQVYTVQIKGTINEGQKFGLWQNAGAIGRGFLTKQSDGLYALTFIAAATTVGNERNVQIYNYPSATATSAFIEKIQVETGNIKSAWRPAVEDVTEVIMGVESRTTAVESVTEPDALVNTVMGTTSFNAKLAEYAEASILSDYATTEAVQGIRDIADAAKKAIDDLDLTPFVKTTQVQQLEDSINNRISQSGGVNLLRNSIGWNGADLWTPTSGAYLVQTIQNPELEHMGFGSGWYSPIGTYTHHRQELTLPMLGTYTLSFYMKKSAYNGTYSVKHAGVDVIVDGVTIFNGLNGTTEAAELTNGFELFKYTFTAKSSKNLTVRLSITDSSETTISGLMLNLGTESLQWSSHSTEVYNTNVRMDINGIQVMGNRDGKRTVITTEEFAGYENDEKIFWLSGRTTKVKELEAEERFTMAPISIVTIDNATYKGWAFI